MILIFLTFILIFIYLNIQFYNKNNIYYDLYIDYSKIDGVGVFTTKLIKKNTYIINIIENDINYNISHLGKKVNHSWNPNCRLIQNKNKWDLYSIKTIYPNEELTANYDLNPDFLTKSKSYYI